MRNIAFCTLLCAICFCTTKPTAQNNAPDLPLRTATISAVQELSFGDLTIWTGSSGGTATVDYNGTRTATGNVVLLDMGTTAKQAIFEFKLCPGRTVTINYATRTIMTGNNGGTLPLHIGSIRIGSTTIDSGSGIFTSNSGCDDLHLIYVGGTIDVGSVFSSPPGAYTGSFQITFNQQ